MKKIYLIFSVFAIVFVACETDFDVNNTWEEVMVIYGLLDAGEGKELQQIKISKAFLGNMGALQMAQYADSINLDTNDLDVRLFRIKNNNAIDSVALSAAQIIREGDLFNDTIMVYEFMNNNFLKSDSEYELVITNINSGNRVTSRTELLSGFSFSNLATQQGFQFGFINKFTEGNPGATVFSFSSITWTPIDNGKIYQIDLLINYTEQDIGGGPLESKQLVFSQDLFSDNEKILTIEGEDFFNFISTNLVKDDTKIRRLRDECIDVVMTVGSENLETYINVNKPITGFVQERPYFTNINNGIGLFSSRFTAVKSNVELTLDSKRFLKSEYGLDRNFQ